MDKLNKIERFFAFFLSSVITFYINDPLRLKWSIYQHFWARILVGTIIFLIILYSLSFLYLRLKKLIKK